MKDDFENQLSQQTLRPIPKDWKQDILNTAKFSDSEPNEEHAQYGVFLARIIDRVFAYPKSSIGTVWILIAILRFTSPAPDGANQGHNRQPLSWQHSAVRLAAIEHQIFNLAPKNNKTAPKPPKPSLPPASSPRSQIRLVPSHPVV